jgi:hypothetical protein
VSTRIIDSVTCDLEDISRRSAEWLESGREALVDELGLRLSRTIYEHRPDRGTLESAVTTAAGAERPIEIIGFWIAALRVTGASWDDIGRLLGISRQAAHHRFAYWEQRYRPFVIFPAMQPAYYRCPESRPEVRARVTDASDIDHEVVEALRGVADVGARAALHILFKQPPD